MARITIDLSKGIFEVEGSEEFVGKHFSEFRPQLETPTRSNESLDSGADLSVKKNQKKTSTRQAKKTEMPETFKMVDEIPMKLANGLMYSKLKKAQDKLLWSLGLAKELGLEGLTSDEIVWVTDRLGAGVPKKQISINFQRVRDKGFANQSTLSGKMRVVDEGVSYLDALAAKAIEQK